MSVNEPTPYRRPTHWPAGWLHENGIACPRCGNSFQAVVSVTDVADLTAHGVDVDSDPDYEPGSHTHCRACNYHGILADFHDLPGSRGYDVEVPLRVLWGRTDDTDAPTSVWTGVPVSPVLEVVAHYWPGVGVTVHRHDGIAVTVRQVDVPGLIEELRSALTELLGPPTA